METQVSSQDGGQTEFRFQGYIEKAERRAITLPQVSRVLDYAREHCREWHTSAYDGASGQRLTLDVLNLYHLNTWLILPATKERDCAFVELLSKEEQMTSYFVSHWWGEPIQDFVACMAGHIQVRLLDESVAYWVCAYANRQHSLDQDIGVDLPSTSFYRAMQEARGVLIVLDGAATPFSRIWCAFEEYVAIVYSPMPVDIVTCQDGKAHLLTDGVAAFDNRLGPACGLEFKASREQEFPMKVIQMGLNIKLESARASRHKDRERILNWIACRDTTLAPLEEHQNYSQVNRALAGFFAVASWRQAVESRTVKSLGLPAILAHSQREELSLEFSVSDFDDADAAALAEGLPPELETLTLNFKCSRSLTSAGFVMLAAKLPRTLKRFFLRCNDCKLISDTGLAEISTAFDGLEEAKLMFAGCAEISDAGVASLAASHWPSLRHLGLDFSATKVSDAGMAAIAEMLPSTLCLLGLFCLGCDIKDPGLLAMAAKLPTSLRRLDLFLGAMTGGSPNTSLSDSGLAGLARHLPAELKILLLRFNQVPKITDAGLVSLASNMPRDLQTLELRMSGCSFTPAAFKALANSIRPDIEILIAHLISDDCEIQIVGKTELAAWQLTNSSLVPLSVDEVLLPMAPPLAEAAKPLDKVSLAKAKICAVFKKFDLDRTGWLNKAELARLLKALGPKTTDRDCTLVFRRLDTDRDGRISSKEFMEFIFKERRTANMDDLLVAAPVPVSP